MPSPRVSTTAAVKAGTAAEASEGVAHVLGAATSKSRPIPRGRGSASFTRSTPPNSSRACRAGLSGESPARVRLLRLEREMRLQFLVEILFHGAATEQGTKPVAQVPAHEQLLRASMRQVISEHERDRRREPVPSRRPRP